MTPCLDTHTNLTSLHITWKLYRSQLLFQRDTKMSTNPGGFRGFVGFVSLGHTGALIWETTGTTWRVPVLGRRAHQWHSTYGWESLGWDATECHSGPCPALASLVVRWCNSAGRCLEHDYAASNRIIPWEMYKATTRQRTAVLPRRAGVDFMLPFTCFFFYFVSAPLFQSNKLPCFHCHFSQGPDQYVCTGTLLMRRRYRRVCVCVCVGKNPLKGHFNFAFPRMWQGKS